MYIDKNGNKWYKGNLHTHTTRSDGIKTPEQTKKEYREMGYDFIAITDHWAYGEGAEADPSGLIVLSGAEYNFGGSNVVEGVFHIVGFGTEEDPKIDISDGAQAAIDKINGAGGLAILAHPAWSLNTCDMILPFRGLFATEIYNSISGLPYNCRPYSGLVIDELAARGYVLDLVADDDTHFWKGEAGMSYIMVNLGDQAPTAKSIMKAIREGRFIATQGPLFSCQRYGDEIVVKCDTPATVVTFFTNLPFEWDRNVISNDAPICEARFKLHSGVSFVRAEIQDADGKTGYARIITV